MCLERLTVPVKKMHRNYGTVPDIEDLLQPLESEIRHLFLPLLTGHRAFNDDNRLLLELPV